jgi:hypothetical protein
MSQENIRTGGPYEEPAKPPVSLDAVTRVVHRQGRWVVMLNVPTWEPAGDEHPVANHWQPINDYSTEMEASVAARWIERSANRSKRPSHGF